jgi:hypothetical protein
MVITYRNISFNIEYPVFLLPSSDWETRDGLLLIDNKIVDDKNKEGRTLGARRMQTAHKDVLPLKKMLTSYNGILKQTTKCFIDNVGRPFIYEKTKFADLKYLQIKGVERKNFATLITVKGHTLAFTVPRPPEEGMLWAGILHLHGFPWVLYEYSETKLKDTKRKV